MKQKSNCPNYAQDTLCYSSLFNTTELTQLNFLKKPIQIALETLAKTFPGI